MLLLAGGADPCVRGGKYGSAMGAAKAKRRRCIVGELKEYDADESVDDKDGSDSDEEGGGGGEDTSVDED